MELHIAVSFIGRRLDRKAPNRAFLFSAKCREGVPQSVANLAFLTGAANAKGGVPIYYLLKNPQNCIKMKENDWVPVTVAPGSTTANDAAM